MVSPTSRSPLGDIEFLARADHRAMALDALARRPQSRADIRTMTDVSQSTIGRTLREFEERRWIKREGQEYEATQLGAYVADGMRSLIERLDVEQRLRDVWELLPAEERGFSVDLLVNADVTVATAEDPYRPVNRFLALLRETERFRFAGLDVAFLEPCKDVLCKRIIEGMQTEMITPPRVATYIRSTYPELFSETLDSGNLTVRLHDGLPTYGVCLYDDRIAICAYDSDSVTVRAFVDTPDSAARDWAESTYASFGRETPTISLESPIESPVRE